VPVSACALVAVREDELVFQPCRCEAFSLVRSGRARRVGMLVCCYALRSSTLEIHLFGEVPGGMSFWCGVMEMLLKYYRSNIALTSNKRNWVLPS
jgi:hypothetical protein